ncbi:hypothetical protein COB55_00330 [Candidatus Wolfebacteria bacterium]|nr:MAG: hypothetical protein COB55_00330 [Candidatus Wolfebacteria bacterium]
MTTPIEDYPQLARALGISSLYFKREDMHPYGSHKGRSIPHMIDHYIGQGKRDFVIASSGNAALAAGLYLQGQEDTDYTLTIFIGENIDSEKEALLRESLTDKRISIEKTSRPQQKAFRLSDIKKLPNLRQSQDDVAIEGYGSLAEELTELKNLSAIFIPTSSGTTAEALATFLPNIEIHIVQTSSVNPIAQFFDITSAHSESSIASAIVDRVAHRKDSLVSKIQESNGSGWIIQDKEILEAQKLTLEHTGIEISTNSALSIAGLQRAINAGKKWDGSVVCLITGK